MALRDMEHDGPRLEQGEIAFFIGRNLPEGMKRSMRRSRFFSPPVPAGGRFPRVRRAVQRLEGRAPREKNYFRGRPADNFFAHASPKDRFSPSAARDSPAQTAEGATLVESRLCAVNGHCLTPGGARRPPRSQADLVSAAAPTAGQPMVRTMRKRAFPAIIFA